MCNKICSITGNTCLGLCFSNAQLVGSEFDPGSKKLSVNTDFGRVSIDVIDEQGLLKVLAKNRIGIVENRK